MCKFDSSIEVLLNKCFDFGSCLAFFFSRFRQRNQLQGLPVPRYLNLMIVLESVALKQIPEFSEVILSELKL